MISPPTSSIAELKELFSLLEKALADFPDLVPQALDFLFGEGESLQPGLIEISYAPALGTGRMTIAFHITDRLREFMAALSTGNLERHCVD